MLNQDTQQEVKRVGRFGLVGIINTLIDLTILNVLRFRFGLPLIPANVASTSVAMTFSFFANRKMVFASKQRGVLLQAIIFLAVTGFGLYVLQNAVIKLLTDIWTAPVEWGLIVAGWLHLTDFLSSEFIAVNGVKAAAIATSMVWNYTMYKRVVFRG